MSRRECFLEAKKALKQFTQEEMSHYLNEVLSLARKYKSMGNRAAIERAQNEIGDRVMKELFNEATIKANDLGKLNELKDAQKNSKYVNTRSQIARRNYGSLGDNVEVSKKAARNELESILQDFTPEEVAYMQDKNNFQTIGSILDGDKVEGVSPKFRQLIIDKYLPYRNKLQVESNALSLADVRQDRFFKAAHDAHSLVRGGRNIWEQIKRFGRYDATSEKPIWRNFIDGLIDKEATFGVTNALKKDGSIDQEKADKIHNSIYDNIVNGNVDDASAPKSKRGMFYVWKDWKSFCTYSQKYGHQSFYDALMADVHSSGNAIGIARKFGSNPNATFDSLKRFQRKLEVQRYESGETKKKPKSSAWWWNTKNLFKQTMGMLDAPVSPTIAHLGANLRAFTGMSRLGGVVASSIGDSQLAASYLTRWGMNYSRAAWRQLGSPIKDVLLKDPEFMKFSKMMSVSMQHQIGYMGKFGDAINTGALTSKVSGAYYHYIGLKMWDSSQKYSAMRSLSGWLGEHGSTEFNSLPDPIKTQLGYFDVTPDEWNALRTKNQNGLFTLDNVNALTDQEIKNIYETTNKNLPLSEMRSSIYRKVFSIFDYAADNSILAPGDWTRSWLGTQAGTVSGEVVRSLMHLKGFMFNYIDRTLVGGYQQAVGPQAKMFWAIQNFLYTLPLQLLLTGLHNLGQGKSFIPNFNQMNTSQEIHYLASSLFSSFGQVSNILDPTDSNKDQITSLFAGPSFNFLLNSFMGIKNISTGAFKDNPSTLKSGGKSLADAAQDIIPFARSDVIAPFVRMMRNAPVHQQPGFQQIYGR